MSNKAPNNGWWRGGVIYQIYPRSYQDSNGDGIGDLPGITARLEHIARLGADGIWLSPFFKSPMKDFGYDVSDYCDVDPMFGTLDDFRALVARAHELGLKVMIDQVLSHTSDQHPGSSRAAKAATIRQGRLVCLGRRQGRWQPAQQLAVHLRRQRLAVGYAALPVLPAQLPDQPAA